MFLPFFSRLDFCANLPRGMSIHARDAEPPTDEQGEPKKQKKVKHVSAFPDHGALTRHTKTAVKKMKKKVKKDALEQSGDEDGASSADADATKQHQDEAKKKRQKEDEPDADRPKKASKKKGGSLISVNGKFAAVGDVDLARSAPTIVKKLYTEHATLRDMTAEAVSVFQAERGIVVEGSDIKPMTAFEQLGCDEDQMHAVRGFKVPSPIQAQCWPLVLSGHDLIGIAATGSGATAHCVQTSACDRVLAAALALHVTGRLSPAPNPSCSCTAKSASNMYKSAF
jgi:ATP-dependent RNA helicase DBP3